MRYPGATEKSLRITHFYTWGQGHQCPLGPPPFVMITQDCYLLFSFLNVLCKSLQNVSPRPLSVALGELWLHSLLIHFNIVIVKGESKTGLLSGSKLIIRASFGTAWDIPKSIYMHDHNLDLFATTPPWKTILSQLRELHLQVTVNGNETTT